jgi:hypothetical protein
MVVPRGRTGSRGRCEGRSDCEVEGGAGGFGTGGGGRGTLSGMSVNGRKINGSRAGLAIALSVGTQWMDWSVDEAYRGRLAERLACDGPGGHAQGGTCQHGEIEPSDQYELMGAQQRSREGGWWGEGGGGRGE